MKPVVPVPGKVTPEWLTEVLREAGILPEGEVREIEKAATGAFNSHTVFLRVHYSPEVLPGIPDRFILKQNTPEEWSREAGRLEAKFYELVRALPGHPPVIIPCYGAGYEAETGNSYVLLKDLSQTHRPPITRDQQIGFVEGMPLAAYNEAVVETLARFHAYWWDHPLSRTEEFDAGYWSRNPERFEAYLARRRKSWLHLLEGEKNWFPPEMRELYEQLFARLPAFWQKYLAPRFRESKNLTLTHGDAYFANFLCPKVPGSGRTYMMDWQSPGFDLAGYDLVNLLATFWTPEMRREGQREEKLLRLYLAVLQEHGVKNFGWDDLVTDYRLGLIFWLTMPLQDRFGGSDKDYWWPKMQCLVAAFHDWDGAELLGF